MTNQPPDTDSPLGEVTQADRDAAASLLSHPGGWIWEEIMAGKRDRQTTVQALARHRIAALASQPARQDGMGEEVREALERARIAIVEFFTPSHSNAEAIAAEIISNARLSAQPAPDADRPAAGDEERARCLAPEAIAHIRATVDEMLENREGVNDEWAESILSATSTLERALQSTPQGEIERMRERLEFLSDMIDARVARTNTRPVRLTPSPALSSLKDQPDAD